MAATGENAKIFDAQEKKKKNTHSVVRKNLNGQGNVDVHVLPPGRTGPTLPCPCSRPPVVNLPREDLKVIYRGNYNKALPGR